VSLCSACSISPCTTPASHTTTSAHAPAHVTMAQGTTVSTTFTASNTTWAATYQTAATTGAAARLATTASASAARFTAAKLATAMVTAIATTTAAISPTSSFTTAHPTSEAATTPSTSGGAACAANGLAAGSAATALATPVASDPVVATGAKQPRDRWWRSREHRRQLPMHGMACGNTRENVRGPRVTAAPRVGTEVVAAHLLERRTERAECEVHRAVHVAGPFEQVGDGVVAAVLLGKLERRV